MIDYKKLKNHDVICLYCGSEYKSFNQSRLGKLLLNIWAIALTFAWVIFAPRNSSNFIIFILLVIFDLLVFFSVPACPYCGRRILLRTDSPMGRKLKAELAPYQNDDASITKTLIHSSTVKGKKSTSKTSRKSKK